MPGKALKLELLLQLKDQATKKLPGIGKALGGLGKIAGGLAIGAAGGVMAVGAAIGKLAMDAAEIPNIRRRFENLSESIGETADTMLTDLRAAVQGTASDTDLMLQSSRLMSMGLADTSEQAAHLAKIAYELGDPTQDLSTNFENLALMLANQSIPRLR